MLNDEFPELRRASLLRGCCSSETANANVLTWWQGRCFTQLGKAALVIEAAVRDTHLLTLDSGVSNVASLSLSSLRSCGQRLNQWRWGVDLDIFLRSFTLHLLMRSSTTRPTSVTSGRCKRGLRLPLQNHSSIRSWPEHVFGDPEYDTRSTLQKRSKLIFIHKERLQSQWQGQRLITLLLFCCLRASEQRHADGRELHPICCQLRAHTFKQDRDGVAERYRCRLAFT